MMKLVIDSKGKAGKKDTRRERRRLAIQRAIKAIKEGKYYV